MIDQLRSLADRGLHVNFNPPAVAACCFVEVFKPRDGSSGPWIKTRLFPGEEFTESEVVAWLANVEADFVRDFCT
jgi:hypothetical protein